jgi:hypothetical protein
LGGHRFLNNEEVEIADGNVCKCRGLVYTTTEFLNSCRDGTNVPMGWEIMFKYNDTSLK